MKLLASLLMAAALAVPAASALAAGETAFTDDTSLAEWAGLKVRLVEGAAETYKITTRADLDRARMDVDRFAATLNRNAPA